MAVPMISAFYGGLLGILAILLAVMVINQRKRARIGIGDGGDEQLARAGRVFGNFAEYSALGLALFALLELCGGSHLMVHLCAGGFVAGRVAHALGLSATSGASPGRAIGVVLTLVTMLAASIGLLILAAPKL